MDFSYWTLCRFLTNLLYFEFQLVQYWCVVPHILEAIPECYFMLSCFCTVLPFGFCCLVFYFRIRNQNNRGHSKYKCLVNAYSGMLMIFYIVLNFIIFHYK